MAPWLQASEYCLLYGPTGIGKSYFAFDLAIHIACAVPFWGYHIPRARRVFYIDGEMGRKELGKRIHRFSLDPTFNAALAEGKTNFKTTSFDNYVETGMMPKESEVFDRQMTMTEVVVIDNLMSCSTEMHDRDTDFQQWGRIWNWIQKHRKEGRTIILLHHTNKAGDQLGTSKKLNQAHVSIDLRDASWNEDLLSGETLPTEFRFRKARGLSKADTLPIFAERYFPSEKAPYWLTRPLRDEKVKQAWKLKRKKMGKFDIAETLGVKSSTVARWFAEPEPSDEPEIVYQNYQDTDDDEEDNLF